MPVVLLQTTLTNIQSMFTNLPVPITSPLALNTLLAKKGLIYTYLDNIDTAYSRAFKQTFVDFESAWGIQACLVNAEARAGGLDPLTSVYHDLWECASRVLPTTMDQAFAFHQCVPLSAWPALDEVQTPYSLLFLGSYNRIFLLLIAAWITTSFAVFTFWAGESPSDAYGKPTALLARSGVVFSGFCALWNGIGVVLVLVYGFTNTSKPNGLPMTLQTVVVTGALTLLATGYFIRDFWEQCSFRGNGNVAQAPDDPQASLLPAATPASSGRFFRAGGRQLPIKSMQGYARVVTSGGKNLTDEEYTPLVASSWSDAWLFVDGLFLLAFMGYSNDVVTAEAGRIFLTVTYAAAGHSALIRFMQEAYLEPLGETFKKSVDRYELRVVSIICSWIVLAFAIVAWSLAIPRYPSGIIPGFVSMSSILPVLAWLILTLVVEIQATPHVILYDTTQIVFLVQVLIRAIFIFIGVTMATADADGNTALQNALAALET